MEMYDRPSVCLRLKVQMLNAEEMETLLYGCVTWSPSKADYDRLRKVHHQMYHQVLLRCLGWRKRKREDHILSYVNVLRTDSESAKTTVRRRREIVLGLRGTHGRRALAEEGDIWGDARG